MALQPLPTRDPGRTSDPGPSLAWPECPACSGQGRFFLWKLGLELPARTCVLHSEWTAGRHQCSSGTRDKFSLKADVPGGDRTRAPAKAAGSGQPSDRRLSLREKAGGGNLRTVQSRGRQRRWVWRLSTNARGVGVSAPGLSPAVNNPRVSAAGQWRCDLHQPRQPKDDARGPQNPGNGECVWAWCPRRGTKGLSERLWLTSRGWSSRTRVSGSGSDLSPL